MAAGFLLAFLLGTVPAAGWAAGVSFLATTPCEDDAKKLCSDVSTKGPNIGLYAQAVFDCLGNNLANLSPGCRAMMEKQTGQSGETECATCRRGKTALSPEGNEAQKTGNQERKNEPETSSNFFKY